MSRTTKSDVRDYVGFLSEQTGECLTFNCWGADGTNRYQLMNKANGKTYGPICMGAGEFMVFLKGLNEGRRL